jgi:hypothetical protein
MKNTNNYKFMVLEIFRNSKYNFKIFKFQESIVKCKWVIMWMTYRTNFWLMIQITKVLNSYQILVWFEIMIVFQDKT